MKNERVIREKDAQGREVEIVVTEVSRRVVDPHEPLRRELAIVAAGYLDQFASERRVSDDLGYELGSAIVAHLQTKGILTNG